MSSHSWPSSSVSPERLLELAREAASMSYSPYSHYRVGAALLFAGDEVIQSCNVENASYGLTICAERSGVAAMVSRGKRSPLAIAVVGSHADRDDYMTVPCPPCGACRQTLAEFGPDMLVVLASENGAEVYSLNELLPLTFTL
ncbi:MAG: cytidine deaminase [Synergistaceae bacterium]|nr:cytidine deaminase [Synergistaceae bacterium]